MSSHSSLPEEMDTKESCNQVAKVGRIIVDNFATYFKQLEEEKNRVSNKIFGNCAHITWFINEKVMSDAIRAGDLITDASKLTDKLVMDIFGHIGKAPTLGISKRVHNCMHVTDSKILFHETRGNASLCYLTIGSGINSRYVNVHLDLLPFAWFRFCKLFVESNYSAEDLEILKESMFPSMRDNAKEEVVKIMRSLFEINKNDEQNTIEFILYG